MKLADLQKLSNGMAYDSNLEKIKLIGTDSFVKLPTGSGFVKAGRNYRRGQATSSY